MPKKLFNSTQPTHIWYADKLPVFGGTPRKISIEEFRKIFFEKKGYPINFSEDIWFERMPHLQVNEKSYLDNKIEEFIKNPMHEKLFVAFSEEFGFAVFARERIEPGILAIYNSEIKQKIAGVKSISYAVQVGNYYLDASEHCGIGAFFNHGHSDLEALSRDFPDDYIEKYMQIISNLGEFEASEAQDFLKSFKEATARKDLSAVTNAKKIVLLRGKQQKTVEWQLNKPGSPPLSERNQLAYAKAVFELATINGVMIAVIHLLAPVEADEPILIDYDRKYWKELGNEPCFVTKTGQVYLGNKSKAANDSEKTYKLDNSYSSIWRKITPIPSERDEAKKFFEEGKDNNSYSSS